MKKTGWLPLLALLSQAPLATHAVASVCGSLDVDKTMSDIGDAQPALVGSLALERLTSFVRRVFRPGQSTAYYAEVYQQRDQMLGGVRANNIDLAYQQFGPLSMDTTVNFLRGTEIVTQLKGSSLSATDHSRLVSELTKIHQKLGASSFELEKKDKALHKLAQDPEYKDKVEKLQKLIVDNFTARNKNAKIHQMTNPEDIATFLKAAEGLPNAVAPRALAWKTLRHELNASLWGLVREAITLGKDNNVLIKTLQRVKTAIKEPMLSSPEETASKVGQAFDLVTGFATSLANRGTIFKEYYTELDRLFNDPTKIPKVEDFYGQIQSDWVRLGTERGDRYAFNFVVTALRRNYGKVGSAEAKGQHQQMLADLATYVAKSADPEFKKVFEAASATAKKSGQLPQLAPESTVPIASTTAQVMGAAFYYYAVPALTVWLQHSGFMLDGDGSAVSTSSVTPLSPNELTFDELNAAVDLAFKAFTQLAIDADSGDPEAQQLWWSIAKGAADPPLEAFPGAAAIFPDLAQTGGAVRQ